ncbi:MAG: hypothetical protein M0Z99_22185 [Betaproteobacteria bacterium]|nr:hypothetical protein [Betaproteobacteria bacterium]
MITNQKLSETLAVLATINPSSQAAGTAYSGWISMAEFDRILALVQVGVFGASATVDANIQQAQDAAGTGAKAIGTGKAIAQMLAAGGNNVQALIDVRSTELDVANGFGFVQLEILVGTAATETAGVILGGDARFAPASSFNQAGVVQIV